jgi:hypothetical protein
MKNSNNAISRALTVVTVISLIFALNVSGALAGFWRTLDGVTSSGVLNPTEFLFGYGKSSVGFGYGYGYGYGNGTFEAGDPTKVVVSTPTVTTTGSISVTIPASTTISADDGISLVNEEEIATAPISTSSVTLASNETPVAAIDFGIPGIKLNFSQPIRVDVPVPGVTSSTILMKIKHHGDSSFGTSGLTNSPSATCSNGVASPASNVATVSSEIATIYSCSASEFVAYTQTSSSSGGGWGGWGWGSGQYSVYSNSVDTSTEEVTNDSTTETPVEDTVETTEDNQVAVFIDISGSWAESYINTLAQLDIVNGNTNGEFEPNRAITRVEFLKMTLRAFGHSYSSSDAASANFDDVDQSLWTANVIGKAASLGVISTSNSHFRPNSPISRVESIKILLNVAGISTDSDATSSFADVAGWSVKYVEKALELWIISSNTRFRPSEASTRAESAKTIVKTINLSN